ncbi:response regulator [Alkalilacustris brevis]|uniref:response regulator n=1 Tax=Alkalilacustris brevis TaxID=2026338 RepID=UPI000E0D53C4|nr:response regulator [Alkalilacustris brevis]
MGLKETLQVLVVDDMATSRGLITQALDVIGVANYDVADDGQQAIARLSARPAHLVISDYNMPGLDGLQLLEALRRNQLTQRIGFILVTGRADQDLIERGRQLAMNNFLKKPFGASDLKTCIEQVFGPL